jgi:hypothetical protein
VNIDDRQVRAAACEQLERVRRARGHPDTQLVARRVDARVRGVRDEVEGDRGRRGGVRLAVGAFLAAGREHRRGHEPGGHGKSAHCRQG